MSTLKAIIVDDDDEIDRCVARRLLTGTGVFDTIVECNDGTQIDKLLKDREEFDKHFNPRPPPALVFLDINMPRMDGFEVLEAIHQRQKEHQLDAAKDCLVVVLSTSDYSEDRERAVAYELVKEYLVKPVTKPTLEALINRWYNDPLPSPSKH